jgi:hypothetical protein
MNNNKIKIELNQNILFNLCELPPPNRGGF